MQKTSLDLLEPSICCEMNVSVASRVYCIEELKHNGKFNVTQPNLIN